MVCVCVFLFTIKSCYFFHLLFSLNTASNKYVLMSSAERCESKEMDAEQNEGELWVVYEKYGFGIDGDPDACGPSTYYSSEKEADRNVMERKISYVQYMERQHRALSNDDVSKKRLNALFPGGILKESLDLAGTADEKTREGIEWLYDCVAKNMDKYEHFIYTERAVCGRTKKKRSSAERVDDAEEVLDDAPPTKKARIEDTADGAMSEKPSVVVGMWYVFGQDLNSDPDETEAKFETETKFGDVAICRTDETIQREKVRILKEYVNAYVEEYKKNVLPEERLLTESIMRMEQPSSEWMHRLYCNMSCGKYCHTGRYFTIMIVDATVAKSDD